MEKEREEESKISEKLVIVLILTLFTIVLWGGIKLIDAFGAKPETVEYGKYIDPIPSSYNETILKEFEKRQEEYQLYSADELAGTEQNTETTTTE